MQKRALEVAKLFRSFLYLDESRLREYSRELNRQLGKDPRGWSMEVRAQAGIGSFGTVGADFKRPALDESTAESLYNSFEELLPRLDVSDFCDLTKDGGDVTTLPQLALFKCLGTIDVLEEFDLLAAVRELLPMFAGTGAVVGLDGDKGELVRAFFERANADIPILISGQDATVFGKLHSGCFVDADYYSLEDLAMDEAFVLGKVVVPAREGPTTVFDPARDFLRLNRAMRRSMKPMEGFEPVVLGEPTVKAEIIAIYH